MGNFLRLSNGVPRSFAETAPPTIFDSRITIVSGTPGTNQLQGPVTTGTAITLPSSQSFTAGELQVYLNGQRLEPTGDYSYVGGAPHTQIQFTFDLIVNDVVDFRVDRVP